MLTQAQFHRLYRISAWYDLLITWPYTTPLTLAMMWQMIGGLHATAGLAPLPELGPYAILFGNFFGTIVVLWSVLRLKLNNSELARWDAVGRWMFSAWMINALLNGASPLLWGFLVIELCFAVLQTLPVQRQALA